LLTGKPFFPAQDSSFTVDDSIFSGERDHLLSVESAPSGMVFSSSVADGDFTSNAPPQGTAYTLLQYDGPDASLNLNPSGALNDPDNDFTFGNAFALHLRLSSDQPTSVEVFVYSGSSVNYCSTVFQVPGNQQVADYVANYNTFTQTGTGCDFTNVGALEVSGNLPPNVDLIVQLFATFGLIANPTVTPSRTRTPAPSNNPCFCSCPGFHCVLEYDPSGYNTNYFDISVLDFDTGASSDNTNSDSSSTNNNNSSDNSSNNSSSDAATLSVSFALIAAFALLMF